MVVPRLKASNVRAGGSAALAVAVMAALVAAPTAERQIPNEIHQVQLTAAVLGAVGNTSAPQAASPEAVSEPVLQPAALAVGARDAVSAAAEAEDNFLDSPLGIVLSFVNFIALPVWFLFTPITLPLSMLAGASTVTMEGGFGTLQFLIATGVAFLSGPLGALSMLLQSAAPAAAAKAASAGRSGSAEVLSGAAAVTAAAPAVSAAEDDLGAGSVHEQGTSPVKRARGRLAEKPVRMAPRTAAAIPAASAVDTAAVSRSVLSVDEPLAEPSVAEAGQAAASTPEARNAEPRAKSSSRR